MQDVRVPMVCVRAMRGRAPQQILCCGLILPASHWLTDMALAGSSGLQLAARLMLMRALVLAGLVPVAASFFEP